MKFSYNHCWIVLIYDLAKIRGSVCISKPQRSLCISFSRTDSRLYIYHLFVWSNFNFLHNSRWIALHTQSCLVLYSFCANLPHALIIWLTVSSLSPHNLHFLFCCGLSILALIWLVLMPLFWAAITRDSIYLLRFPFLSHVHVFSCEMLLVSRFPVCWSSCCQYCFWWLKSVRCRCSSYRRIFKDFIFLVMSKFSRLRSRLFVYWNVVFLSIFVFWLFLFCWSLRCLCNQFSSKFVYVVFLSLYRSINAVYMVGKSSSSFFSRYIHSVYVISGI